MSQPTIKEACDAVSDSVLGCNGSCKHRAVRTLYSAIKETERKLAIAERMAEALQSCIDEMNYCLDTLCPRIDGPAPCCAKKIAVDVLEEWEEAQP